MKKENLASVQHERDLSQLRHENHTLKLQLEELKESLDLATNSNKIYPPHPNNQQNGSNSEESSAVNDSNQQSEQYLIQQIYLLQEELLRVKFLLDQSQSLRKIELDTLQKFKNKLKNYDAVNKSDNGSRLELMNQIAQLQATENQLRASLEGERLQTMQLNEKIAHLKHQLSHHETNEPNANRINSAPADQSLHIKIKTQSEPKSNNSKIHVNGDEDINENILEDYNAESEAKLDAEKNQNEVRVKYIT